MQGLAIRLARGINRASGRRGRVFGDRYHARVLRTLRETRHAVEYVRRNWEKHQARQGRWSDPWWVDPYSSMSGEASWYVEPDGTALMVVVEPESWLLRRASG
jgi:hypothetical protein